jgi:hypothetical protein
MRHLRRGLVAASILGTVLLLILSVLAVTGRLHADWYPELHTFGASVGSDTHYCSAELVRWHPSITCETSR